MQFKFEELRVYQYALKLSSDIFSFTNNWSSIYRYSLADQLNRAALSIPLNIAEGSSRTGKDFQHFLSIARGSCYECVPLITIATEKQLLKAKDFQELKQRIYDISKMISSLRSKISN